MDYERYGEVITDRGAAEVLEMLVKEYCKAGIIPAASGENLPEYNKKQERIYAE